MCCWVAHQIPAAGFQTAVTDTDYTMTGRYLCPQRDESLEADQQRLSTAQIESLRHVVVGGDHVADRHPPPLAEKAHDIELSDFTSATRIDANDPRRVAFDGDEQDLALAGRVQDRR